MLGSGTDCCAGCSLIQQNIALHLVCCITKGAEQTVRIFSFKSRVLSPFCVMHYKGGRTNCRNILIKQSIVTILCAALQRTKNKLSESFSFSRVLSPFCVLHYKGRRTNCRNHSHLAEHYFPFSLLHKK